MADETHSGARGGPWCIRVPIRDGQPRGTDLTEPFGIDPAMPNGTLTFRRGGSRITLIGVPHDARHPGRRWHFRTRPGRRVGHLFCRLDFALTGQSVNTAAPLAGDWASTLSWDSDSLVLTMTGTIDQRGTRVPVVTRQVLAILKNGPHKGDLKVETRSTPAGVLPPLNCHDLKQELPLGR